MPATQGRYCRRKPIERARLPLLDRQRDNGWHVSANRRSAGNCDNTNPGSFQSVTCDPAVPPNPSTTPITAQPGSNFVIVNVLPGAVLQTVPTAISVANNSFPIDNGLIITSGPAAFGMVQVPGVGSGIGIFFKHAATGTIVTTGAGSHGINVTNPGSQTLTVGIINSGTIAVSGANANGINYTEQNACAAGAVLITNTGTTTSTLGQWGSLVRRRPGRSSRHPRRHPLLYGRTLLDNLHERVGEEEHLRAHGGAAPHLTTTELGAGSSANTAIATVTVTAYSAPAPSSTSTFWRCRLVKAFTARKGRAAEVRDVATRRVDRPVGARVRAPMAA